MEKPSSELGQRDIVSDSVVKKKWSGKKMILVGIAAILIIITVIRLVDAFKPATVTQIPPVNVKVQEVQKGSIYATAPLSGRIQAKDEIAIIPLASGEVTSVNVEIGDFVSKGTTLFEIDKTLVQNNLSQAQSAVDQAHAGIRQAQAGYEQAVLGLENAVFTYNSMKSLYDAGAISLQQFLQAELQYKNTLQNIAVAEESLNVAKAGAKTAESALSTARDALSNYIVKAPISAYITSLNVNVGSLAPSNSPAATMADINHLEIKTTVSEYLAGKLAKGDKVEINISNLSDTPFPGTVKALSPAPAMGTLTYPITISIDDSGGRVKAGMFAEIQIVSDKKEEALRIPSSAVMVKGGNSSVAVLDKKNIPTIKKVTTGLDNGEYVEITKGLGLGEIVVVSGQEYVTEGVAVKIVK
ncbi:MAG: efflux RND transporter periplasmic adaptor subunit [Anaerovoracaceae bacterium]|jgi:multidrug efflux pump subunit AcrA (membrane-fusion protein)